MTLLLWQSARWHNEEAQREYKMSFRKASVAAIVALSMASAPALAQAAAPASALSLRAGAETTGENELGGGFIIPLLALAAIVAGILVVIDGDDDEPVSP